MLIAFTASALVPILILSGLAFTTTRDQLEEDALLSLQRETKAAAVSIAERLSLAAAQLDLIVLSRSGEQAISANVFARVTRTDRSEVELEPRQWEHLTRGGALLLRSDDEVSGLRMIRAMGEDVFVGSFDANFLYGAERIGPGERYWISDHEGTFLFGTSVDSSSELSTREVIERARIGAPRESFEIQTPTGRELAVVWPLFLKSSYLSPELKVGVSRSERAIFRALDDFRLGFMVTLLVTLLGSVGIALQQVRVRIRPLEAIVETTRELEKGNLGARSEIVSGDEFEILGASVNSMAAKLDRDFRTMETLRAVANALIGVPSSIEVSEFAIPAAIEISGAVRASLFVADRLPTEFAPRLVVVGQRATDDGSASDSEHDRQKFAIQAFDAYEPLWFVRAEDPHAPTWHFLERTIGRRVEGVLAIPLISGVGEPDGVLELIFEDAPDLEWFENAVNRSLVILAAQIGAALRNVALIEDLRGLFEGIVGLTVNAIDKKSPYTGDHCRRVPILTELIADAVCSGREGALKDFTLSEAERYELKIAALLHDCGKVATPVHVMDKSTKLQTIYDRIELVRLRAEILRRDLELNALNAELSSRGIAAPNSNRWGDVTSKLDEDLALVERCNVGGEFMPESEQARIDEILAAYAWVDWSGHDQKLITEDEAINLKIRRGTLNDEERQIINDHVVTTIDLLNQLPFPPDMRKVPAIAGAHHERVDGTGYPKGLGHEDLSMQGRILGLADVFEALTAKTRPYKPGISLTETLRILERMVDEGHLDRDLHEVFIREKVYLQYAVDHMDFEQIDEAHRVALEAMSAPWAEPTPSERPH
jgi:HD-GYP domain-containing protein (c-di-GMP phosphodiesterase class II)